MGVAVTHAQRPRGVVRGRLHLQADFRCGSDLNHEIDVSAVSPLRRYAGESWSTEDSGSPRPIGGNW
jgi:hypothetical protein